MILLIAFIIVLGLSWWYFGIWLAQFLLGMFVGYLVISPRLRGYLFRKKRPIVITQETPKTKRIEKPQIGQDKGRLVVDDNQVNEWLAKNPELSVRK